MLSLSKHMRRTQLHALSQQQGLRAPFDGSQNDTRRSFVNETKSLLPICHSERTGGGLCAA